MLRNQHSRWALALHDSWRALTLQRAGLALRRNWGTTRFSVDCDDLVRREVVFAWLRPLLIVTHFYIVLLDFVHRSQHFFQSLIAVPGLLKIAFSKERVLIHCMIDQECLQLSSLVVFREMGTATVINYFFIKNKFIKVKVILVFASLLQ